MQFQNEKACQVPSMSTENEAKPRHTNVKLQNAKDRTGRS